MSGEIVPITSASTSRVLPHSLEAEKAVVGGVLLHPKAFSHVAGLVVAEDFYHPSLGAIFQAMSDLDDAGQPVDEITVAGRMKVNDTFGKLRAFGFEAFFSELSTNVLTVENIDYHAKIVRRCSAARRVLFASQEITAKGYSPVTDLAGFPDEAEGILLAATQVGAGTSYARTSEIVGPVFDDLEDRCRTKTPIRGVPTGFKELDKKICGLQVQLVVVAGRPSMGKTSLVMNFCENAAIYHGVPSLVFELEMTQEQLVLRELSGLSGVEYAALRAGAVGPLDPGWVGLNHARKRLNEAPIFIDETPGITWREIRAKARRWRANPLEGGLLAKRAGVAGALQDNAGDAIVVIDHLGLIRTPKEQRGPQPNREREVAEITRSAKALAKELRCPVVLLSQLNRELERRPNKRPVMSDLRDSGSIEQDADTILFVYRDEVYNPKSDQAGTAEIIIGKQRDGERGMVRLAFWGDCVKFNEMSASQANKFGNEEAAL